MALFDWYFLINNFFLSAGQFWLGVLQNFLGGVVAIITSLWIYLLQQKRDDKSKLNASRLRGENQLKAFAYVINKALNLSKKQSEYLNILISDLKRKPNVFPKLNILPLGHLKSLIESITIEGTGEAYMKYFHGSLSVEEFTKILDRMDYLYSEFESLRELNKTATLNDFERRQDFVKYFNLCYDNLRAYVLNSLPGNRFARELEKINTKYECIEKDLDDLGAVNSNFFEPLFRYLQVFLGAGGREGNAASLFIAAGKGIDAFKSIENGYEKYEEEISQILKSVEKYTSELKAAAGKILESQFGRLSDEMPKNI